MYLACKNLLLLLLKVLFCDVAQHEEPVVKKNGEQKPKVVESNEVTDHLFVLFMVGIFSEVIIMVNNSQNLKK